MDSIIKHIVISGGGPTGLSFYGVLKETHNQGLWSFENIQTIYGTSVGAIISVILCLNYDWETLDEYLIKRPWSNVYKFNMYSLIDSYQKRGIFDIKVIEETFSSLFRGKDISLDITMKEFYELTKVEIHMFSTELISYKLIDFSYKTHPDWKVIDVVYCSACLPIIFSPFLKGEECYCDGGFISSYPLEYCINNGADINEVLGIRRIDKNTVVNPLKDSSSLLDFIMIIINNVSKRMFSLDKDIYIKNEYIIESDPTSIYNIYSFVNSSEDRKNFINMGMEKVKK
jgi:predicted acylesterase/phospholipase RssA